MLGDAEIEDLQNEIAALEEQLTALKTELRDKRFAGVREAMKARKEADQLLSEELRALGVRRVNWHPFI
jgi:predicted  nucleic acid-binding Zn-ribbon protein